MRKEKEGIQLYCTSTCPGCSEFTAIEGETEGGWLVDGCIGTMWYGVTSEEM